MKVRYNHYCKEFDVIDGVLDWVKIDEQYCLGFVFKGLYNVRLLPEKGGGGRLPMLLEGAAELKPVGGRLQPSVDEDGERIMIGTIAIVELLDELGEMRIYQLQVDEDEVAEAAHLEAIGGHIGYKRADADGLSGVTQASKDITKELKSMSVDEIRGGSDRYKELVAARDLEDALYGNG